MKKLLIAPFLFCIACQEPVISTNQIDNSQNGPNEILPSAAPQSPPSEKPAPAAKGVQLSGVVKDAATGQLLAATEIRIDSEKIESDDVGFYKFTGELSGPVKIIVARAGYTPFTQTLNLSSQRQILDILLFPETETSVPTPAPSSGASTEPSNTPETIILLPDGTASNSPAASDSPSPQASSTASATPAPEATTEPTPEPTATPLYDPKIEEVAQTQISLQLKANDLLSLTFLFETATGLPVNWEWGTVNIEYFLATSDTPDGAESFLTSGKSLVTSNGDGFSVSIAGRELKALVKAQYTMSLPDGRIINQNQTIQVNP